MIDPQVLEYFLMSGTFYFIVKSIYTVGSIVIKTAEFGVTEDGE